MKLIIGLGNPEDRYESTRHNVGFMVVDHLARKISRGPDTDFIFKKKVKAMVFSLSFKEEKIMLVKPQTYMNNSGWTAKLLLQEFKLKPDDIWIIHDDMDLPLGKIRIRMGGASGGHNGVQSMIEHLGTDAFLRFRLGIGRGKKDEKKSTDLNLHQRDVERFVLSPFTETEAGDARKMIKNATDAVVHALEKGVEKAMNQYN